MLGLTKESAQNFMNDCDDRFKSRPSDIVGFCNRYFPLNTKPNRPNLGPDMPALTAQWLRHWDRYRNTGIIGPPGFTKTATMERVCLRLIAENYNSTGAYVTRIDDKAMAFVKAIEDRISGSTTFQNDYGIYPDKNDWSKHHFKVQRTAISKDPTLLASTPMGTLEASRLDYLLIDDITDRRSMRSAPERKMVQEFMENTAFQRLDPGGILFFIGSRWEIRDIFGWLQKNEMFLDPETGKTNVIVCQAEPEPGRSLDEDIFPYHLLKKRKSVIGLPAFNLRYQQEAASQDTRPFHDPFYADLNYLNSHQIWFRFFGMDLNASERKDSNLTAVVFFTVLSNRQVLIDSVYTSHLKRDYDKFLASAIRESSKIYFPYPIVGWIEDFGFQIAVIENIKDSFQLKSEFNDLAGVDIRPWGRKRKKSDLPDDVHFTYQDLEKKHRIVAALSGPIQNNILGGFVDPYESRKGVNDIIQDIQTFPDVEFFDPLDAAAIGMINIRPYLDSAAEPEDSECEPESWSAR